MITENQIMQKSPHVKEWTFENGSVYEEGVYDIVVEIDRRSELGEEVEIEGTIYRICATPATETFQIRKKE